MAHGVFSVLKQQSVAAIRAQSGHDEETFVESCCLREAASQLVVALLRVHRLAHLPVAWCLHRPLNPSWLC